MLSAEINPRDYADEYLKNLNLCFGHWGDERLYQWIFERPTVFPVSDQIIVRADDIVLSGSANTYRRLAFPNGKTLDVGIMTGSWTLLTALRTLLMRARANKAAPQTLVSGGSAYARIISESLELAKQRGCGLLLGFVTADNSSYRQLAEAGSALLSGAYLFTTPETPIPAGDALIPLEKTDAVIDDLYARSQAVHQPYVHYDYVSPQGFREYLLERVDETQIFRVGQDVYGIIEKLPDNDRIQLFLTEKNTDTQAALAACLRHSLSAGRKCFVYTTREDIREAALNLGMGYKPGYITILAADEHRLREALSLPADAPLDLAALFTDASHPAYAGAWHIHSGDRS
jgi:hypothetical protein